VEGIQVPYYIHHCVFGNFVFCSQINFCLVTLEVGKARLLNHVEGLNFDEKISGVLLKCKFGLAYSFIVYYDIS
jgi:hypothetical protein